MQHDRTGNQIWMGALVLAVALAVQSEARSAVLFSETFDTDATGTAGTLTTYPGFSHAGPGNNVSVTGGQLRMPAVGAGFVDTFSIRGFAGDLTIELDLGADPGSVQYNVGMAIGDNRLIFHPGFAGGAFRVDGPGGFGNTDMGYTPSGNGVMHHMRVDIDAGLGLFDITVTSGASQFVTSFTNAGYQAFDQIGFTVEGNTVGAGLFDNLVIEGDPSLQAARASAPASAGLVLAGLLFTRRKGRCAVR
ncbi:MAG: hypothetical protein AAF458_00735 [Pseudomonadota bacterium]